MTRRAQVTAIVPTFEEADLIERCLRALRDAGVDEIIVVDGGSSDATVARAQPLADEVIHGPRGLFDQLNRGAESASGDVLLFHYADGELESEGIEELRRSVSENRVDGGAFRLRFESRSWFFGLILFGSWLRARVGLGPFGDQSIFARAELFEEIGGFASARMFADYELARAVRSRGRFRILESRVTTSVRRWERKGRWRTMLAHFRLSVAYLLGRRAAGTLESREVEGLREVR